MRINRCVQFLAVVPTVICMTTSVASASVMWQPVAVSTTMGESSSFFFPVGNLIDQTGLTTPYVSGVTDAATYSSIHNDIYDEWVSTLGTVTGFVSFDLGSAQEVDGFRLWNSSWDAGGSLAVDQFTLFADNDFDPTNGLGVSLGTFNASLDYNAHAMQSFSFASTMTQYAHMEILTNYGGIGSGFSEGAFTVPEPATELLVGLGLAGLCFARRRSINA